MEVENSYPDYINYLLAPDTPLDFQISVGDPETTTPETFGVVKWMLIAHSKVLRAMLLESKMRHEEQFNIADVDPLTFKNFLIFLYGYNNTSSLSFEDAIKLLNVAEKYDVPHLKRSLGEVIQSRVTPDNVLVVLQHGPVCEKSPELWTRVTQVIQSHTQSVFSQANFLTASPEAVLHIVQQDCLSVPEIDVWRAVLKWTTHRVSSLEGTATPERLRNTMSPLLKHTRLCTLSPDQIYQELVPTEVLTHEETVQIFVSISKQKPSDNLLQICNKIEKRGQAMNCITGNMKIIKTRGEVEHGRKTSKFYLLTKEFSTVELCGIVCEAQRLSCSLIPKGVSYQCECNIKISRVTDYVNTTYSEPPVEVYFIDQVQYNTDFTIPLQVVLKANNKYIIEFEFTTEHTVFQYKSESDSHHVTDNLEIMSGTVQANRSWFACNHLKKLHYKELPRVENRVEDVQN